LLLMYRFGRLVVLVYIRKPCSMGPGHSEGPEPVSHGSSDPMSEPVSRARGGLLDARYIECARPTGGSHGRIIRGPAQRRGDAKRRPRSTSTVVERGQGQYKGRSPKAPSQSRFRFELLKPVCADTRSRTTQRASPLPRASPTAQGG